MRKFRASMEPFWDLKISKSASFRLHLCNLHQCRLCSRYIDDLVRAPSATGDMVIQHASFQYADI